ncbi:MAG: alpha/beta hydrolase [Rubrobacteraceae bacterium]|nr:alpha/beta hydrolase [Rubrobacteraceae bacterium]
MQENVWKSERVPGEVELAIWRAGEGPDPVICLHGITAQHRAFNAAARYLGPSRGLVGVDLRGRGDSDKPKSGYGLETHASDVIRVLDHLGLDQAILVGHSMGAFVALKTALASPGRVRALVLLDGGWPRVESSAGEMTEEEKEEAAALEEGLARAFRRLDMTFESPEAYLDFWFPDRGLTMDDLPPDLADYYLYDLGEVDGGHNPKASRAAAEEDSPSVSSTSPTAEEMRGVSCPVALVRAEQGFFVGSDPLISEEASDVMAQVLDVREEVLLEGANHYTMLWPEYTKTWAPRVFDPPFWER